MKRNRIGWQEGRIRGRPAKSIKRTGYVLLLLFALFVNPAQADWKEYAIARGDFAISMPTPPVIEQHTINTDSGMIDTQIVLAKIEPLVAYAVVYCEYEKDTLFCRAPEKYLNSASDQMVREMNGSLISQSRIMLDGFPGREVKIAVPNGVLHLKLFAVGNRSYQIYAVALDGSRSQVDARKFLASFRLLNGLSRRNSEF